MIASAEAYLASGVGQSQAGHLNRAREDFDRALDVYLNAPGGALSNPQLAKAYRQTLETIQLHEFEALAAGDGFTETLSTRYIDEVAECRGGIPASEETRGRPRRARERRKTEHNANGLRAGATPVQGPLRSGSRPLAAVGRYLPLSAGVEAEASPRMACSPGGERVKTGALSRAKAGRVAGQPRTGKRSGEQTGGDERSSPIVDTGGALY